MTETDQKPTAPKPPPVPPDPSVRPANVPHPLPFERYRKFADEDMRQFMDGKAWVPNFEPATLDKVLPMIISGYGRIEHRCRFKVGQSDYGPSAIYFCEVGQGGGLTGTGVLLYQEGWAAGLEKFKGGTFAICKHEKVESDGANHDRGWHPGYCKHCGFDMSVDSGD